MDYIATFYTHSGAVKYTMYLHELKIKAESRPVPRELSSNCGVAVQFTFDGDVSLHISEDMEKLFKITPGGYRLIYEND